MTLYLDTSQPGRSALTASGQVKNLGAELPFYLTGVSNFIQGQATGPSVQFKIYSKRFGIRYLNVDYGQASQPTPCVGYLVEIYVPTSGGSVNVRCVIATDPQVLTPITVAATVSTQVDVNVAQVNGATPNLAKETGGALAGVETATATVATTVGASPTTNKVTTQT